MPFRIPSGAGFFTRLYPGFIGPSHVDEIGVFTSPLEGLDKYSRVRCALFTGSSGGAAVDSDAVPAGKQWFIPFASGSHDDGANSTSQMRLFGFDPDGTKHVGIAQLKNCKALEYATTDRPFLLGPLWKLRASHTSAIAAGKFVTLRFAFLEMPAGEFVPGI